MSEQEKRDLLITIGVVIFSPLFALIALINKARAWWQALTQKGQ